MYLFPVFRVLTIAIKLRNQTVAFIRAVGSANIVTTDFISVVEKWIRYR